MRASGRLVLAGLAALALALPAGSTGTIWSGEVKSQHRCDRSFPLWIYWAEGCSPSCDPGSCTQYKLSTGSSCKATLESYSCESGLFPDYEYYCSGSCNLLVPDGCTCSAGGEWSQGSPRYLPTCRNV